MAQIVRYRLSFVKNDGSGYQLATKEFRSFRQALEFCQGVRDQGGTIKHLRKWVQVSLTPDEESLMKRTTGI